MLKGKPLSKCFITSHEFTELSQQKKTREVSYLDILIAAHLYVYVHMQGWYI